MAYALGLAQFGYEDSLLEKMAYELQGDFERGRVRSPLVPHIEAATDAIWKEVDGVLASAN
jgi:hypothetical protein